MAAIALVVPILPGKLEPWRRFCQALQGSRRCQYEELLRRLGVTTAQVWLHNVSEMFQREVVIVHLEAEHPERVLASLATSDSPFDRWFRWQLLELHGIDLTQPLPGPANELVLV